MGQEIRSKKFLVPGGLSTSLKRVKDIRNEKMIDDSFMVMKIIDEYISKNESHIDQWSWKKDGRASLENARCYRLFCAAARNGSINGLGYPIPFMLIKKYIGKKNHATIIYHVRTHENMCDVYPEYREWSVHALFKIAKFTNVNNERVLKMRLDALTESKNKIQQEIERISKILNIPIE